MRISKGYWLWGLFPSVEKVFLNQIKAKVQSKLKSPFFETKKIALILFEMA